MTTTGLPAVHAELARIAARLSEADRRYLAALRRAREDKRARNQ